MSCIYRSFIQRLICLVILSGMAQSPELFASSQTEQMKKLNKDYLIALYNLKTGFDSNNQLQFESTATLQAEDCDPAPIPLTPVGPTVTRNYSRIGDKFEMTAWRIACNETYSYVIITVKPISIPVWICWNQLTLVQNGLQDGVNFRLLRDPIAYEAAIGGGIQCGDLYVDTSFALYHHSLYTTNIDIQKSFEIYWNLGDNTQHFTMFAYDPRAYGIGGPPPTPELINDVGVNGLFYDPNNSGHGFDIIRHETGLVVYYYGHSASGERLWLVSGNYQGDLEYNKEFHIDMYEISEGTFGHPVLPSSKWGSIYMEFADCDSGQATLSGIDGILEINFVRLAGIPDIGCE